MSGKIGRDISSEDLKDKQSEVRSSVSESYGRKEDISQENRSSPSLGDFSREIVRYGGPGVIITGVLGLGYKIGTEDVSGKELVPTSEEELYDFIGSASYYSTELSEAAMENSQEALEVFSALF